jgi:ATP adenylyltransferase
MEYLHAPWRIEYILAPKPPASARSLFTQIAESSDDVANLVIKRERSCYALLNRYPYNGGHLLVVPYKQTDTLSDLTPEELRDLMLLVRRCIEALQRTMKPDGFNVGLNLGQVAGAGVLDHLHFHVVPRWNGDTNFMPVLGQTSVVPDALEEVAARLRAALAEENETTEKQPPEPPSPESAAAAAASVDVD